MKTQNTTNYSTLTFTIKDLRLLQEGLLALELRSINVGSNKKDDINRLYHAISIAMNNDTCTANSESALMNS